MCGCHSLHCVQYKRDHQFKLLHASVQASASQSNLYLEVGQPE